MSSDFSISVGWRMKMSGVFPFLFVVVGGKTSLPPLVCVMWFLLCVFSSLCSRKSSWNLRTKRACCRRGSAPESFGSIRFFFLELVVNSRRCVYNIFILWWDEKHFLQEHIVIFFKLNFVSLSFTILWICDFDNKKMLNLRLDMNILRLYFTTASSWLSSLEKNCPEC